MTAHAALFFGMKLCTFVLFGLCVQSALRSYRPAEDEEKRRHLTRAITFMVLMLACNILSPHAP